MRHPRQCGVWGGGLRTRIAKSSLASCRARPSPSATRPQPRAAPRSARHPPPPLGCVGPRLKQFRCSAAAPLSLHDAPRKLRLARPQLACASRGVSD